MRRKTCHAPKSSQGSLGGMVLHSCCLHLDLDRKYYNRTRQRSTLPFSTTETSPGCYWGVGFFCPGLSHIKWQEGQLLAWVFTGPPWMTLNLFITWTTPIQSHPCHTCSGYSSKDQFAPKLSSSFNVCWSAPMMSLSTLVLGEMIDLFGSPRDTCSGYQFGTVCNIVRLWFCTYLSLL